MPIDPKDVMVGHCYAIAGGGDGQHRRGTALVDGTVHYGSVWESAEDAPSPGPSGAEAPPLETFAKEAEEEIPCPEIPKGKPSKAEG